MEIKEELQHQLHNKYEYSVTWSEEEQTFVAFVAEFPKTKATGSTPFHAMGNLRNRMKTVVEQLQKAGKKPPQPFSLRQYSGKLSLRLPKSLHRLLAQQADLDGVSLNQFILSRLERSL